MASLSTGFVGLFYARKGDEAVDSRITQSSPNMSYLPKQSITDYNRLGTIIRPPRIPEHYYKVKVTKDINWKPQPLNPADLRHDIPVCMERLPRIDYGVRSLVSKLHPSWHDTIVRENDATKPVNYCTKKEDRLRFQANRGSDEWSTIRSMAAYRPYHKPMCRSNWSVEPQTCQMQALNSPRYQHYLSEATRYMDEMKVNYKNFKMGPMRQ